MNIIPISYSVFRGYPISYSLLRISPADIPSPLRIFPPHTLFPLLHNVRKAPHRNSLTRTSRLQLQAQTATPSSHPTIPKPLQSKQKKNDKTPPTPPLSLLHPPDTANMSEKIPNSNEHLHDLPPATCKVVSAATVAEGLLKEVRASLEKMERAPLLVGFLANGDPAARMYANWTQKTCKQKYVPLPPPKSHHRLTD